MNPILKVLFNNPGVRKLFPYKLRTSLKGLFQMEEYNSAIFSANNPYAGTSFEWGYDFGTSVKVGILYDPAHYHRYYISACLDLRISYQVIDIRGTDWLDEVKKANVQVFMVWPSLSTAVLKEMIDERSQIIQNIFGIRVYPAPYEIYLLDNKRRLRDWLMASGYAIPDTWTFYRKNDALDFVEHCKYPVVFKSIKEEV